MALFDAGVPADRFSIDAIDISADAIAVGVPWRIRQRQFEFLGELFGHGQSLVAERGQRSRGATELQRQRVAAQVLQPLPRAMQRCRIFGELQPKGHRQRML